MIQILRDPEAAECDVGGAGAARARHSVGLRRARQPAAELHLPRRGAPRRQRVSFLMQQLV